MSVSEPTSELYSPDVEDEWDSFIEMPLTQARFCTRDVSLVAAVIAFETHPGTGLMRLF